MLIGAGILLLLSNLGYLPWQSWNLLWRLWPVLLIALGVDVLIGRRSMIGALFSGLLILLLIGGAVGLVLLAPSIPALSSLTQPIALHTEHVEHPLADVERATVRIDWTSAPGYLSTLDDSPNLIEADVTYRGELIFDVDVRGEWADVRLDSRFTGPWIGPFDFDRPIQDRWVVGLSPNVPLDLTLDAGSGSCDFDLTSLEISDLTLDVGSGAVDLALPTRSTFEVSVDGGSGSLIIDMSPRVMIVICRMTSSGIGGPRRTMDSATRWHLRSKTFTSLFESSRGIVASLKTPASIAMRQPYTK